MPKVNVNAATAKELVEAAGLRPELAEAIIKLRDERGRIGGVDELDAVQGVGPATLERLRETLSFGATAEEKAERESAKATQASEGIAKETAGKVAEVATSAIRSTVEAGRGAVEAGARAASDAARSGLELAQRAAGAMGQAQRERVSQSAQGIAELNRLWTELLKEQARHNAEATKAIAKTVDWEEMARLQGKFMRASFERMNQLNSRYLETVREVMKTATEAAKKQTKKAE